MATYSYAAQPTNLPKLREEIQAATFAADIDNIRTTVTEPSTDHAIDVDVNRSLTAGEQTELDGIIAAHDPTVFTIAQKVQAARAWSHGMMDKYQTLMIAEGIIQAGKAHEVATKLAQASILADLGNLYALDAELATVTPTTTFLEQSRIDTIRNEVRTYLTLPLLWDAATSYVVDDVVHHAGTDYQATAANTNDAPPSANWTAL